MDWNAAIDAYCERLQPHLWAEPLNAVSNLAFWLAAWLVWRQRRLGRVGARERSGEQVTARLARPDINALLIALVLIGAGSLAFHTFATVWAQTLDVLFIAVYLHFYLAVYAHRALGLRWRLAWLGVPAFALLSLTFAPLWQGLFAQASGELQADANAASRYAAAWTVLLLLLAHSTVKRLPSAGPLALAAACFAPSLVLRQLDLPLCEIWPLGTHFAWHLLNAATLALTSWAMLRLADEPALPREPASAAD